jgi:hypothetical protein
MSLREAYSLKGGHNDVQGDAVLSGLPGTPLMLTENVNTTLGDIPPPTRLTFLGLVNGTIVEFHRFYGTDDDNEADPSQAKTMKLPPYMLVKLLHKVEGVNISIPGLPPSVIAIKPVDFTYRSAKGKSAKLQQFPVTLGYAITESRLQMPRPHIPMGDCRLEKAKRRRLPFYLTICSIVASKKPQPSVNNAPIQR